jgi:hypothetical protein
MTISDEQRQREQEAILTHMLSVVRDDQLLQQSFVPVNVPELASFANTSFVELQEQGLIERRRVFGSIPHSI